MRKFLMVAAVVAVAACGEKKTETTDSTAMMAPTMASDSMMKADSMMKHDSMMKADSMMKHDSMMAPAPKP